MSSHSQTNHPSSSTLSSSSSSLCARFRSACFILCVCVCVWVPLCIRFHLTQFSDLPPKFQTPSIFHTCNSAKVTISGRFFFTRHQMGTVPFFARVFGELNFELHCAISMSMRDPICMSSTRSMTYKIDSPTTGDLFDTCWRSD